LGYEYKCWARFNSWFDMPDDSWRCKQWGFKEGA
jgi:hypothetical protein